MFEKTGQATYFSCNHKGYNVTVKHGWSNYFGEETEVVAEDIHVPDEVLAEVKELFKEWYWE